MAFKILSLDGGGSWALIQARVLKDIYGDIEGHDLLRKFDLAIANSGGSLVLACLCNNMKLSAVIKVFEDQEKREKIFMKMNLKEKWKHKAGFIRNFSKKFGPKYNTHAKLSGIYEVMEEADTAYRKSKENDKLPINPIVKTFLDEIPGIIGSNYNNQMVQLVIVGYDYFRRRGSFFRSRRKSAANRFSPEFLRVTLGDAIHASSNAPVNYFDEPATIKLSAAGGKDTRTTWYWDGAVSGFNNPVLAGLIEAITNGISPADCRILALGTGTGQVAIITDYGTSTNPGLREIYRANLKNKLVITNHGFSFFSDVQEIASSILADPPDSDTYIAYSMMHPDLSQEGNIVRINPILKPVLDNTTNLYKCPPQYDTSEISRANFQCLLVMDMDAVEQPQVNLITELCDNFIVNDSDAPRMPNQLIRGDLTTEYLGQPFYAEARARWKDITGD